MDRDRLEQEAVRLLGKGQTDRALEKYVSILRAHPKERRIRQKVAELMLQTGQVAQAEKHYREVAKQMIKGGQQRAAINIFKQLVKMKPDDTELRGQLGDCLLEEGFENDAVTCYGECMEKLGRVYPDQAITFCEKLIKLAPGDFTLKIRKAEFIEKAKWSEAAAAEWHKLAGESRRLGRPGEATRFLEFSLRQRGENPVILVEAAEGQIEEGDVKRALQHLQLAHQKGGPQGKVFALLGTCFQELKQTDKAQKLWLQAAKAYDDENNEGERARALKVAIACGATDSETKAAYDAAHEAAARVTMRLHTQDWAAPATQEEGVPVIQAETYWKYGFPDRALALLTELEEPVRSSISVRVRVVELRAAQGDLGGSLEELRMIQPSDETVSERIWTRISVLSGEDDDDELIDDEDDDLIDDDDEVGSAESEDDEIFDDDDDDLVDDDDDLVDDDEEEVDDDLTDPGSTAPVAPSVSIEDDPLDFSSDFGGKTLSTSGASFGNIFGEDEDSDASAPVAPAEPMGSEGLADVRAWLAVGRPDDAAAALEGKQGLEADLWRAVLARQAGDVKDAFSDLRDAIDDARETHEFFPEALLELARLATMVGKERAAKRTLRQLEEKHRGFRDRELASLKQAIELLREG